VFVAVFIFHESTSIFRSRLLPAKGIARKSFEKDCSKSPTRRVLPNYFKFIYKKKEAAQMNNLFTYF
jgi:hypothetical protein